MTSFPSVAPLNEHKVCPLRKLVVRPIWAAWERVAEVRGQAALRQSQEGSSFGITNQREIRTLERIQRGLETGRKSSEGRKTG